MIFKDIAYTRTYRRNNGSVKCMHQSISLPADIMKHEDTVMILPTKADSCISCSVVDETPAAIRVGRWLILQGKGHTSQFAAVLDHLHGSSQIHPDSVLYVLVAAFEDGSWKRLEAADASRCEKALDTDLNVTNYLLGCGPGTSSHVFCTISLLCDIPDASSSNENTLALPCFWSVVALDSCCTVIWIKALEIFASLGRAACVQVGKHTETIWKM